MANIYFASDNNLPGRDGSTNNPYRDPGELPSPYLMVSGNSYFFRCDTITNFTNVLQSTFAGSPLVIGSWGSGQPPEITRYRMIDRSECVEVAVDNTPNPATLTVQAGTNLWRVPKTFFGMTTTGWLPCVDVINRTGSGKVMPAIQGQYCGGLFSNSDVAGGYAVIYSTANPVDYYGGLYAGNIDDTEYANSRLWFAINPLQAWGGFAVDGIKFSTMWGALCMNTGSPAARYPLYKNHVISNSEFQSLGCGMSFRGDALMTTGVGFLDARVYRNKFIDLGGSAINSAGSGSSFNGGRIYENVLNGFCKSMSWGGIYLGSLYTTDGSKVMVERNCASGGVGGNYWANDGYAFYQEEESSNIVFRRNFSWNNDLNYHNNNPRHGNIMAQNVCIGKPGVLPQWSKMFGISGGDSTTDVTIIGNVSVGCLRFISGGPGSTGIYLVLNNVSVSTGDTSPSGEGSHSNAIRTNHHDYTKLIVDGNNFYNHDIQWADYNVGTDLYSDAPYVNNKILTNPSAELARLPTPTDPTVNYALQLSPNFWSGAVDLRPGTRVVT